MPYNLFCSCDNINRLLSVMFKNSEIVSSMAEGRTKCSYLINFDLAPYFKNILETKFIPHLFL